MFIHCVSLRITETMKILTVFGFIPPQNDQKTVIRFVARISQQIFLVMLIIPSVSVFGVFFLPVRIIQHYSVFIQDNCCRTEFG